MNNLIWNDIENYEEKVRHKAMLVKRQKKYAMSEEMIAKEIFLFDETFLAAGFSMMSSNYPKYLRGWLLKAEADYGR